MNTEHPLSSPPNVSPSSPSNVSPNNGDEPLELTAARDLKDVYTELSSVCMLANNRTVRCVEFLYGE